MGKVGWLKTIGVISRLNKSIGKQIRHWNLQYNIHESNKVIISHMQTIDTVTHKEHFFIPCSPHPLSIVQAPVLLHILVSIVIWLYPLHLIKSVWMVCYRNMNLYADFAPVWCFINIAEVIIKVFIACRTRLFTRNFMAQLVYLDWS